MNSCKFCKFKENEENKVIFTAIGKGNVIPKTTESIVSLWRIEEDGGEKYYELDLYMSSNVDSSDSVVETLKINFCPMCGRKLSE